MENPEIKLIIWGYPHLWKPPYNHPGKNSIHHYLPVKWEYLWTIRILSTSGWFLMVSILYPNFWGLNRLMPSLFHFIPIKNTPTALPRKGQLEGKKTRLDFTRLNQHRYRDLHVKKISRTMESKWTIELNWKCSGIVARISRISSHVQVIF